VVLVDFTYKLHQMEAILEACEELIWIDHHVDGTIVERVIKGHPKLKRLISRERSGAYLAWQYFFPNREVPKVVQHVDDRDRYMFDVPNTREATGSLTLTCRRNGKADWEDWELLFDEEDGLLEKHIETGKPIRAVEDSITFMQASKVVPVVWEGYRTGIINAQTLISDTADRLKQKFDIAWVWGVTHREGEHTEIWNSLRKSNSCPADLSQLARTRGGGGHATAAGWTEHFDGAEVLSVLKTPV